MKGAIRINTGGLFAEVYTTVLTSIDLLYLWI